jgi:serine/threonine-protein kinase RsbW
LRGGTLRIGTSQGGKDASVQLTLALCLPREEGTVGLARRALSSSLTQLGVTPDCVHDIELAISEACTNVIRHAQPGEEYEISLEVVDERAVMRVIDTGQGFDWELSDKSSEPEAESGRGIELMRALVDHVRFEAKPEAGTIVHLEKGLEFTEDSVVRHHLRD